MYQKINIRILKIVNRILSIAFAVMMVFLYNKLNDMDLYLFICIPSVVICGLSQGINILLIKHLEEAKEQNQNNSH